MYKSVAFKARGEFRINIKTSKENQQIIIKETNQTLILLEHCTYQSLTWQSGDLSSGMQSSNFSLAGLWHYLQRFYFPSLAKWRYNISSSETKQEVTQTLSLLLKSNLPWISYISKKEEEIPDHHLEGWTNQIHNSVCPFDPSVLVEIPLNYDGGSRSSRGLTLCLPLCRPEGRLEKKLGEGPALLADTEAWQLEALLGMVGVCLSRPFQIQHTPEHEALPKSLHFYLRMLENIFSYGIQVRGILDVADIVSHSLDHHIARWQDQLVGPDLRKQAHMSIH